MMEINLRNVIMYNANCLQDKNLLRNIISDMYPGNELEKNILLQVYDIGIIRDIARGNLTELQYIVYFQKLTENYGLQSELVFEALNAWIDVFLKPGYSDRFSSTRKALLQNKSKKIIGSLKDYELVKLSETTAEIKEYIGENVGCIVIPTEINGIRIIGIGEDAYAEHNEIKCVIIPEGIEYIGERAFCECDELEEVTISSTVKLIGSAAFGDCHELHTVHLKEGLLEIGVEAFLRCVSLEEIIIPSTVKTIGGCAFSDCYELHTIHLKEGLHEIMWRAFWNCKSLEEIRIPSSVKEISYETFIYCDNLRAIYFEEELLEKMYDACRFCNDNHKIKFIMSNGEKYHWS